ncbi:MULTISPECIES: low molecular weight protein tyrosine phosphatase family protein [unclassified Lentimonas]|uniref:low molecular weight protein tyrosine phosphatase family protein n=1 Tax=unclassified Lentimonas TaxID=2630993 RepID=UPI0013894609|nr:MULTISPECIES: phosphotyrosine protein phosphatase [unclassified Lentimonas]
MNVLFVCSMNQWRSPTAEKLYSKVPLMNVRSAGTSSKARRHVSLKDLQWADLVIVMESKHKQQLAAEYRQALRGCEVHVLEIEDRYKFMDPELVEELKYAIDPIL